MLRNSVCDEKYFIQRGLGRVTVRVLGPKKLSRLQRRLRPIRPGKKQRWLPYLFNRGCSSTRLLDYSTRSKSNFQYSMMLVLDFYKSGNARPDSILELEAHEYPKHEINKKSMEISTKILKSTYKICKNEAKIKKKSYIFTFRQSHNSI
mgnify:CR=1 FL=1